MLDLSFPVTSISTGGNRSYSNIHCLMCYKCFWLNKLLYTDYCIYSTAIETRNYQIVFKIISYIVILKFISQGRDEIYSRGFHHNSVSIIWLGMPRSMLLKSEPKIVIRQTQGAPEAPCVRRGLSCQEVARIKVSQWTAGNCNNQHRMHCITWRHQQHV